MTPEIDHEVACRRIYASLVSICGYVGEWSPTPREGLGELVWAFPEQATLDAWDRLQAGDDSDGARMAVASAFWEAMDCLQSLVNDGRVEAFMRDGWPAYRPVLGWAGIAIAHDDDFHRERVERQAWLRRMPYVDYLLTPEWQAKRVTKLAAAGDRCELCDKPDRMEVHHRTYKRRGNELLSDLIVLCHVCHAKFHDRLARG